MSSAGVLALWSEIGTGTGIGRTLFSLGFGRDIRDDWARTCISIYLW